MNIKPRYVFGGGALIIVALILVFMGTYSVPEGHVAIVKAWGKAERQEGPGLQLKVPIMETYELMEVRERKSVAHLSAATADQLPAPSVVSLNWTLNIESAMSMFVRYGGLEQFADRVLDPRIQTAAKEAISKFTIPSIIRERGSVVERIKQELDEELAGLPITVNNVQLEDVDYPDTYMEAVLAKEEAREIAEKEKHKLVRQQLVAQQEVQTAEADRDAKMARADGEAYRIKVEAEANAEQIRLESAARSEAVELVGLQLNSYPMYIDYVKWTIKWGGKWPEYYWATSGAGDLMNQTVMLQIK